MKKNAVFTFALNSQKRFQRLLGDSSKAKGLAAGLVTLRPRESVGEHKTERKEEIILILKGQAVLSYGRGKKTKVKQGTFVYIPPETIHDVKNPGRKNLQYVYITACVSCKS